MTLTSWMDRKLYPAYGDNWDNQRFRGLLESRISPSSAWLDLGAGRGALAEMGFRGRVAKVVGVDPDPVVLQNPFLDEARVIAGTEETIPYPRESFDLVFANNVLEHLADPRSTLREVFRVLKPGGLFLAKTPNRRHYVSLIARWTPQTVHVAVNRWRGRPSHDTFPTHYRCNTRREVEATARGTGFEVVDLALWEGRPEYLRMASPLYVLGYLYERLVNRSKIFSGWRCVLVVSMQKPSRS